MPSEHDRAQMITERRAAELLGVSVVTLRRWRYNGDHGLPVFVYPSGTVRYDAGDVVAFRDASRRRGT